MTSTLPPQSPRIILLDRVQTEARTTQRTTMCGDVEEDKSCVIVLLGRAGREAGALEEFRIEIHPGVIESACEVLDRLREALDR